MFCAVAHIERAQLLLGHAQVMRAPLNPSANLPQLLDDQRPDGQRGS
jgi:hypothetical protein